jgi:DNA-directed RNA polymerase specialized sigma subunit
MTAIALARKAMEVKKKQEKIESIITQFTLAKGRAPTNTEIVDELEGQVALEFVERYIEESRPLSENIIVGDANV